MTEEGDNPIVSGEFQPTSMESLNDELTPKTDKPHQELESGNNIQHEISGFEKFLTTSAQVIRLHRMPILIYSIVCFVFNNEIVEISLARTLFAISFNIFAILLMITLIKGEKDSRIVKMEYEVKSKSVENENLQRKLEAKQAEFDQYKVEYESEKKARMVHIKSTSVESENLKRELKVERAEFDQHKVACKSEKNSLITTMQYNFKFKSAEIKNLKSRISQLEDEAKTATIRNKPAELTIFAKFPEISKLEDDVEIFSQPTKLDGITWKTSVEKCGEYFDFYLNAENKNEVDWCCPVIAEFQLFSEKSEELVHRVEMKMICDAESCSRRIESISLEDLFDEEKGFVNDDSITVAVAIRAFPRSVHEITNNSLRVQFPDISKITDEDVCSEPTEFEGITWAMSMRNDASTGFAFCLEAEKEDADEWWCPVLVDFNLVSQKSNEIVWISDKKMVFDAKYRSYYIENISFEDLFDEDNGYVMDDSIIVEVVITVLPVN